MRKVFLLLMLLAGVQFQSKADTIDYYHVYFNTSVIRKYNVFDTNKKETLITFQKASLESNDAIQVRYWNDIGTSNSGTIKVYDETDELLQEIDFENKYYTLPVAFLLQHSGQTLRVSYLYHDTYSESRFENTLFYLNVE